MLLWKFRKVATFDKLGLFEPNKWRFKNLVFLIPLTSPDMCCVAGAWRLMVLCEGGGGKGWGGEREVATIRDTGDLTVFISPLYLFCGKFLGRCYVSWCRVRYYCWGLNFSMTGGSVYLSALIGSDASLLSLIHQTLIYQSANQSPVFRAWGLQTLHNILSYSWRSLTNLKTGRWFAAPLCPGQGSCNTIQTCIAQRQPVENQSRAISLHKKLLSENLTSQFSSSRFS